MCSVWCQHPETGGASVLVVGEETWSDRVVRIPLAIAAAQLRHGWRNLVGIALLVGLIGGLVLAGLAGSIRTATAVDRMIESTDAADVLVNPDSGDDSVLDFAALAALPNVAQISRVNGVLVLPRAGEVDSFEALFSGPLTLGTTGGAPWNFQRPVLIAGRMPDPDALDEIYLDRTYAADAGLDVGDVLEVTIPSSDDLGLLMSAEGRGEDAMFEVINAPGFGTPVDLNVVGIGNGLEGIVVDQGYEPVNAWITPALFRSLGEPSMGWWGAVVRLTSHDQVMSFRSAVDAMAPNEKIVYQTRDVTRAKALRGTQPAAVALAIFAGVTALLGLLIIWQAIARRCQLDGHDNLTLAAIGATRSDRASTLVLRLTLAAGVGAIIAILIAIGLSWFAPVGPARNAEPDLGWDVNVAVVVGGALLWLLVVALIGVGPAWRNSRRAREAASPRPSAVASWLGSAGISPHVATGVRFGLEPGSGATAVPTRATNLGAITAVAIAVSTIVFAASLDRVVDNGRFFGSNFDVVYDWDGEIDAQTRVDRFVTALRADPDVDRADTLRVTEVELDGFPVTSLALGSGVDAIPPTIASGRAPVSAQEVALAARTMDRLGVGIGDQVSLISSGFEGSAVVVGRVVLPSMGLYEGSDRTSIGEGALVSPEALLPFDQSTDKTVFAVDLRDAADATAFDQRLQERVAEDVFPDVSSYSVVQLPVQRPSEVDSLDRLRSLPLVLSGLLVFVVGVTVVNAMVVAVRRRRHDLAVMQSMGSTNGNVTTVGVSQGVTIGAVGLLVGLPLGVVAGRWLWTMLANAFGTLAEPVVPLVPVVVLSLAVLTLAALSGVVPVRLGLRQCPAEVLRSE